jgi:hypothetical protein
MTPKMAPERGLGRRVTTKRRNWALDILVTTSFLLRFGLALWGICFVICLFCGGGCPGSVTFQFGMVHLTWTFTAMNPRLQANKTLPPPLSLSLSLSLSLRAYMPSSKKDNRFFMNRRESVPSRLQAPGQRERERVGE